MKNLAELRAEADRLRHTLQDLSASLEEITARQIELARSAESDQNFLEGRQELVALSAEKARVGQLHLAVHEQLEAIEALLDVDAESGNEGAADEAD